MQLIFDQYNVPYSDLPGRTRERAQKADSESEKKLFSFLDQWFNGRPYLTVQTSGSTGKPKEIKLLKEHMKQSAEMTREYFAPWNEKPALLCLGTDYIAGKMMLIRALCYNIPLICVPPSSNPLKHLSTPVQFCAMVPAQVTHSMAKLPLIEQLIIGGAPVSPDMEEELQNIKTRCYATYGMTETMTHIALKPLNGKNRSPYFTFLKGVSGSADDEGCLHIHAPRLGIERLPTNDVVELKGNRFQWLGRKDFVINSGGLKIHPEEAEKKLSPALPFPFYSRSEPDELLGQKHVLVVKAAPTSLNKKRITDAVQRLINDKKKRPKKVYFVNEVPLTATGKIKRSVSLNTVTQNASAFVL